jgi:site-specific recombinase XerC
VQLLHVVSWIEAQMLVASASTIKQRLAAIRHLFDWLVIGRVVDVNPARAVRGPKHIVRKGKTSVLEPAEARTLLDGIDVTTPVGLRDRALIVLMVYSFACIGAALGQKVEDVYNER